MKKSISAVAIAAVMGFGLSGAANALTVDQITSNFGDFLWEDDDIEWQEVDLNNNGLLDVGDTLKGVVKINFIQNINGAGNEFMSTLAGNSSLTGVFETEVTSVSPLGGGLADFEFGAVGGSGTVFSFYEDSVVDRLTDITNCGARAACIADATAGNLILELGFTGDVDEYWVANGGALNPDLTGIPTNQALGSFNFGLGVISSAIGDYAVALPVTAPTFGDALGDDIVGWNGSGSVLGADGIGAAADATSDTDFGSVRQVREVPAPSALMLLGLGLAALGASRRKA